MFNSTLRAILVASLFVLVGFPFTVAAAQENTCPVGPGSCWPNQRACCFANGTFHDCTGATNCCTGTVGVDVNKSYCPGNQICTGAPGTCGCPLDKEKCGDNCVDTDLDNQNCGGCGNVCITTGGHTCWEGNCTCPPSIPEACPDGMCVNFEHDPTHCGGCAYRCRNERCQAGHCMQPDIPAGPSGGGSGGSGPSTGSGSPGGNSGGGRTTGVAFRCPLSTPTKCEGRCVDTKRDSRNCGECNRECNAGFRCIAGECRQLDIHAP